MQLMDSYQQKYIRQMNLNITKWFFKLFFKILIHFYVSLNNHVLHYIIHFYNKIEY